MDIDEIVMPTMPNVTTLPALLEKIDNDDYVGFSIQNVFMVKDEKDEHILSEMSYSKYMS